MDSGDTSKTIATEAWSWSRLMHSILSSEYMLGTKNIPATMGSGMHSQVEQPHEHEKQQGIQHIQDSTTSSKYFEVVQVTEDQQGIEHIQYFMRSKDLPDLVQVTEDQQGIEHIRYCMRSKDLPDVVQVTEDQQGIEHIQYSMRSKNLPDVVQVTEDQQDIEHIPDWVRSEDHIVKVTEAQQDIEHIRDCVRSEDMKLPPQFKDMMSGQQMPTQQQLQQMKGFQDMKLPPQFKDMKMPPSFETPRKLPAETTITKPASRRPTPLEASDNKDEHANKNISAHSFSFRELATATSNFRKECLIGEGGFGRVYKGKIDKIGQVVAIKQLDRNGMQGNREFLVEVLILSLLHHQHLVNLIGYCADGDQRLLVYEYMPLGSLEDHLFDLKPGQQPLDWFARMNIALHAAKGLEFVHDKANPPVINRDLKSSNILLDQNFNAKLSDFGLAKLGPVGDKTHVSSRVMGTYGYCAPEYQRTGQLTVKSDVYSFGVVLLEMITGRRAIDTRKRNEEQTLVAWAEPMLRKQSRYSELVDPLLEGAEIPKKSLNQAVAIAAMCLHDVASARPLMSDVVSALSSLGIKPKNIVDWVRSEDHIVKVIEDQQDIEHIRECVRSKNHIVKVTGDQQNIEHIRDCVRSKHCVKFKLNSSDDSDAPEELNYENQQWVQAQLMSRWIDELLDLVENRDLKRDGKIFLIPEVGNLIELLHQHGVDTIRSGVAEELENLNQKHVHIEKDEEIHYKKKGLEAMLRICNNEMCEKTIYRIRGKAEKGQVFCY